MALFEFRCPKCGNLEEKLFKAGDKPPRYFYNTCCYVKSERIISIPAKRRDMTVVGDNKL